MIRVLLHHVLIQPDKVEEADDMFRRAKAAGIELALDKREQKAVEYGTVLQVGPTAFIDLGGSPDIVKVGDRVSFARYAGKEVADKTGDRYILLNDQDVLCVIE